VNGPPLTGPTLTASWALAFRVFGAGFYSKIRLLRSIPCRNRCKERRFPWLVKCVEASGEACKTVRVTPGPDVVQSTTRPLDQPLGSARGASEELGPISPELALVDDTLAERARKLLPEPREHTSARRSSTPVVLPSAPRRAPRARPRRWRRTAVIAVLVFVAGAASGGLLGRKDGSTSRPRLEAGGSMRTTLADTARPQMTRRASAAETKASPTRQIRRRAHGKQRRPAARRTWAANVLGVTAGVDASGVKLVWKRPSRSDHVVVLRALGSRKETVVVFHGRAAKYRDGSAQRCSAYRYTIVNYDALGHRSTGVPTSVVTQGCG
jgi:hypothetical protein